MIHPSPHCPLAEKFKQMKGKTIGIALDVNWHVITVGRRSGGRPATTLVATKNEILLFSFFFSFFSPWSTFLIEGVLGSKNLFRESCRERPKI